MENELWNTVQLEKSCTQNLTKHAVFGELIKTYLYASMQHDSVEKYQHKPPVENSTHYGNVCRTEYEMCSYRKNAVPYWSTLNASGIHYRRKQYPPDLPKSGATRFRVSVSVLSYHFCRFTSSFYFYFLPLTITDNPDNPVAGSTAWQLVIRTLCRVVRVVLKMSIKSRFKTHQEEAGNETECTGLFHLIFIILFS